MDVEKDYWETIAKVLKSTLRMPNICNLVF